MPTVDTTAGPVEYMDMGDGPAVVLLHGLFMNHRVWDRVVPLLPDGLRLVLPDLPLGAHRRPMRQGADLTMDGMVRLVAEFMEAAALDEVTLVLNDWGGPLFLTDMGLDQRVARLVVTSCEAFDNFPPGLPGRTAGISAHLPGGIATSLRLLRVEWVRRLPMTLGPMAKYGVPQTLARAFTDPGLADRRIRADVRSYLRSDLDTTEYVRRTEALTGFDGPALVLWSPETRMMPPEHGPRLAQVLPRGELVNVPDAYVLSMLDQPRVVAEAIGRFLATSSGEAGQGRERDVNAVSGRRPGPR